MGVDAICDKAGVKKGSFYHFFTGKDDLVVAALDAHWQVRREAFDSMFSPSVAPLERFRRYFAHVFERQTEVRKKYGRVLGCFHNSVGTECIQSLPAIAAKVQEVLSSYKRYFETAIRDGQAAGDLPKGDPVAEAAMLFAMSIGVAPANSILVVTFANEQRAAGMSATEAALEAGSVRLRPVMMTALAMLIGMVPMSLNCRRAAERDPDLEDAGIAGHMNPTTAEAT